MADTCLTNVKLVGCQIAEILNSVHFPVCLSYARDALSPGHAALWFHPHLIRIKLHPFLYIGQPTTVSIAFLVIQLPPLCLAIWCLQGSSFFFFFRISSSHIFNSVCWSHALVNGPTSKRPARMVPDASHSCFHVAASPASFDMSSGMTLSIP